MLHRHLRIPQRCIHHVASHVPRPSVSRCQVSSLEVQSEVSQVPSLSAAPSPEVSQLRSQLALLQAENEALKQELAALKAASAGGAAATACPAAPAPEAPSAGAGAALVRPRLLPSNLQDIAALAALPAADVEAFLAEGIAWPAAGERFWERSPRHQPFPLQLQDSVRVAVERDTRTLQVVHITAELAPIGKVGGLGDVVSGLSKACIARGHAVSVIMPFYESLDQKQIEGLKHEMDIDVPKGYVWDGEMRVGALRTSVFQGRVAGVPVYLLRPTDWGACNIFKGGAIYRGSYDEREAYLYMCRASLEFLKCSQQQPHIIQVHDWHAAAVPLLYWEAYHAEGLWRPRIVLTIHNLDNTGEVRQDEFAFTGLPGEQFAQLDKALDERTIGHNPERLNLMKGGVVYSNAVTTVSPTYASDIVNAGAGGFLRPVFNQEHIKLKFSGILNGVDAEDWDPSRDPLLPANYSADLPAGKALCKAFLQQGLGLAVDPRKPLMAVVSRLVGQKNPGLMLAAALRAKETGAQFVLLGSGGQDAGLKRLAEGELKDHPDVRILIMYSERLSHMIYAAADYVLVPSNFEPCGLTQLIAMRYGALPVVRRTGGLADTVRDLDTWQGPGAPNGFTFDGADAGSLHAALDRAVALYRTQPQRWLQVSQQNMRADVSWALPAKEYVALYNSIAQF
ncbi:soluble starch synthase [Haematococcus lacustris]